MASPTLNTVDISSINPAAVVGPAQYLLYGTKWGAGGLGTGATVTYSFPSDTASYITGYGDDEWSSWYGFLPAEQTATINALNAWSNVANISFTQSSDNSTTIGELRFAMTDIAGISGSAAYAYLPTDGGAGAGNDPVESGDIWINIDDWESNQNGSVASGSFNYHTLLHEIGHALGLKHPFESPSIQAQYDSYKYTIMSYTAWPGSGNGYSSFAPTTPMYYDIVAIQALYGVKTTYRTGNDTYTFNQDTKYFQTIYDGGGTDTIVFSGTRACSINLNDAAFSSLSDKISFNNGVSSTFTVCIGPNTIIENATSGSGNDTLTGNNANNVLNGAGGGDAMYGVGGNDTYYINNTGDQTIESPGGGTDNVLTVITWALAANIENLTIIAPGAINAVGNELNNIIVGGAGVNVLAGAGGADTINGKGGNDVYSAGYGDILIEDADSGADTVNAALNWTLGVNFENLVLTGNAVISGTGNGLANSITGNTVGNALRGEGGNDKLMGGFGADILTGGNGNDIFLFNTTPSATNNDMITDFSSIADTIYLDNAVFSALGATGVLASAAFRIGAAAVDSSDRIIYDSTSGALIYDSNGSVAGGSVQFAKLSVGLALTNNDFLIV